MASGERKQSDTKIRRDFPLDEGMRVERPERIVRLRPNLTSDPSDASDKGPHVDRVGMPSPDDG